MNLPALSATAFSCCLLLALNTTAQSDTARFDIGTNSLIKNHTQYLTVKGEDLQHLPFTSLGEAIQVYFNGAYTTDDAIAYLIDGNLSNNINTYSVYDIETITLIQNAQSLLSGGLPAQFLVLVKTKASHRQKNTLSVAANSYFVKQRKAGEGKFIDQDNPTLYHDYYLSAGRHFKKTELGGSVNFLHNAFPVNTDSGTLFSKAHRLSRIRFNAWMSMQTGRRSTLTFRINSSLQDSSSHYQYRSYGYYYDQRPGGNNFNLLPSAAFVTHFSASWNNEANISYLTAYSKESDEVRSGPDTYHEYMDQKRSKTDFRQLLVRDQVGFKKTWKGFVLNPTLAVTARMVTTKVDFQEDGYNNGQPVSYYISLSKLRTTHFMAAPAVNMSYLNMLALSGGIQFNRTVRVLNPDLKNTLSPFFSIMADPIKMINPLSVSSFKIYASAASSEFMDSYYQQPFYLYDISGNAVLISPANSPSLRQHLQMLGATLYLADRLQFSYNHDARDYFFPKTSVLPGGNSIEQNIKIHLTTQRFSVSYNTVPEKPLQYKATIAVYAVRSSVLLYGGYRPDIVTMQYEFPRPGVSGGLSNQLSYHNITGGLNCLYYFKEQTFVRQDIGIPPYSGYTVKKSNSFVLQNVYFGYKVPFFKSNAEVYASTRNLFANKASTLQSGYSAYYGLGIKAGF